MLAIPDEPQKEIILSSLEWIIGKWKNEINGDVIEEHWAPQLGDAMPGWFRWKRGNIIFLYEFMVFQQIKPEKVVLKIKHFNGGFEGWESKNSWTEYQAWSIDANRIMLKAASEDHTPWFVYEYKESKLYATFYNQNKEQTDQFVFNNLE